MKRAHISAIAGLAAVTAILTANPAVSAPRPTHPPTVPPAATGDPVGVPASQKIVGMSAPARLWSERINEVGSCGVEARRVFATLQSNGKAQSSIIEQAVANGMMPVISYKVPSIDTMLSGGYDSWLKATRSYLDRLGVPVTATFWHEPYGDVDPADFRGASQLFLDAMKSSNIKVGPILNGWLLDNKVADFASFTNKSLLTQWDFVAVDSYQSGTADKPGNRLPARAIPLLATWLDNQGFPDKKIGIGEYNGFSGAAIKAAGEAILSTPEVWFGLAWNSAAGDSKYAPLTGDRLTEYQNTKADTRAARDTGC
ncbi:MAG TPA: hypothetical protein PLZ93_20280 [Nocardioides sp.]|uniref:hypothetical protein n=1 Tax=uncultured Nocardioides sp. TaxID=198441 RepID=UPI000ED28CDA|nr:hypothetical protein [uncultured Nocardioides sp.]HCB07179.1 hypothetical protein [Nocardioides sp.]HRD60355.1 hypothetical protein [Nocardioides sp.]HRI97971.1 hypothetical protein [Nocardioides sp.]HRK47622.1 hypothetical protein [Nocardioides sp.]